ncbi:MAG: hypothetical protein IJA73_02710, partial [Oscillospiraceae bacterium]|nr:hypothetical protein [Oscillospiraceae bacterium]
MKKRSRKRIFAAAAALALLVSLLPEVGLDTRADEVYEGADDTGVVYETEKDTTPVGPEQDEEPGLIVMDEVVYESAGTHSHPLCGAECAHGDHGDVEWVALTQDTFQGSSSTADFFTYYSYTYEFSQGGNYYLAEDINLGNCYLYILADTNF